MVVPRFKTTLTFSGQAGRLPRRQPAWQRTERRPEAGHLQIRGGHPNPGVRQVSNVIKPFFLQWGKTRNIVLGIFFSGFSVLKVKFSRLGQEQIAHLFTKVV
jgi:hypothetical protein